MPKKGDQNFDKRRYYDIHTYIWYIPCTPNLLASRPATSEINFSKYIYDTLITHHISNMFRMKKKM